MVIHNELEVSFDELKTVNNIEGHEVVSFRPVGHINTTSFTGYSLYKTFRNEEYDIYRSSLSITVKDTITENLEGTTAIIKGKGLVYCIEISKVKNISEHRHYSINSNIEIVYNIECRGVIVVCDSLKIKDIVLYPNDIDLYGNVYQLLRQSDNYDEFKRKLRVHSI
jgi:hypothetical protein